MGMDLDRRGPSPVATLAAVPKLTGVAAVAEVAPGPNSRPAARVAAAGMASRVDRILKLQFQEEIARLLRSHLPLAVLVVGLP